MTLKRDFPFLYAYPEAREIARNSQDRPFGALACRIQAQSLSRFPNP